MSLATIKQKLVEKVGALSSINAVYDYEASNSAGSYPYATVTLRSGEGQYASTAKNLRRQGFRVRVYQEQSKAGQGPDNAERIATSVLDELQLALDADTTLGGTCKYARPADWTAAWVDRELDTRILEIEVDAYELVDAS